MTDIEAKRERLRKEMKDCPACVPEDADTVDDGELDDWLGHHGVHPEEGEQDE